MTVAFGDYLVVRPLTWWLIRDTAFEGQVSTWQAGRVAISDRLTGSHLILNKASDENVLIVEVSTRTVCKLPDDHVSARSGYVSARSGYDVEAGNGNGRMFAATVGIRHASHDGAALIRHQRHIVIAIQGWQNAVAA